MPPTVTVPVENMLGPLDEQTIPRGGARVVKPGMPFPNLNRCNKVLVNQKKKVILGFPAVFVDPSRRHILHASLPGEPNSQRAWGVRRLDGHPLDPVKRDARDGDKRVFLSATWPTNTPPIFKVCVL
jgi:hypothetical protein